MAAKTFQFRLITPQGKLLEGPATYASIPAHDGLMGILPNRAAMVVKLGLGELKVELADGMKSYLIDEGFAQMATNRLTVLAARANDVAELNAAEAKAELAAADARRPADKTDADKIKHDKERARAKMRLAKTAR